jgi:uncharacterized membrane protein (UPF0127 family)
MKIPVFAALALLVLTAQTPPPTTSAACPDTALPTSTFIKADAISAKGPKGAIALVTVNDNASRDRGLMCVVRIPHARGMIFVFPGGNADRGFWMKDTLVALDMVWVRTDGTVTSIAANIPPTPNGTPDDQVARRNGTGQYVIEFGGGDAARLGLKPGAKIRLPKLTATE